MKNGSSDLWRGYAGIGESKIRSEVFEKDMHARILIGFLFWCVSVGVCDLR